LRFTTYAAVRAYYQGGSRHERSRRFTHKEYEKLTLPAAIRQACDTMELTILGPKKDTHKRYSTDTLEACREALLARQRRLKTSAAAGFDELLRTVGRALDDDGVKGVLDLGRYDFAVKIGAPLKCEPAKRVYVHRTPLYTARRMGLPIVRGDGQPYVLKSEFPADLVSMRADSLENMMCVCSDDLVKVASHLGRYS
jgi:hypothetical protein